MIGGTSPGGFPLFVARSGHAEDVKACEELAASVGAQRGKHAIVSSLDIPYREPGPGFHPRKHCLDVYAPADPPPPGGYPVICFVHGGGWKRGDRRWIMGQAGNTGRALAQRGFVVMVPSYRLSRVKWRHTLVWSALVSAVLGGAIAGGLSPLPPLSTAAAFVVPFLYLMLSEAWMRYRTGTGAHPPVEHPEHVRDAATAVAWTLRNVARYGGDPSRVAVMGHSAGGHITSMLAAEPRWLAEAGVPFTTARASIRAWGLLSGVYSAALLEDTRVLSSWAFWRWLGLPFRRCFFLTPVFGADPSKWHGSFPTGVLDAAGIPEQRVPPARSAWAIAKDLIKTAAAAARGRGKGEAAAAGMGGASPALVLRRATAASSPSSASAASAAGGLRVTPPLLAAAGGRPAAGAGVTGDGSAGAGKLTPLLAAADGASTEGGDGAVQHADVRVSLRAAAGGSMAGGGYGTGGHASPGAAEASLVGTVGAPLEDGLPAPSAGSRSSTSGSDSAASLSLLRDVPVLLTSAQDDWGLDEHADGLELQLAALGSADVTRFLVTGTSHVGWIVGFDRKGWSGDILAAPFLAAWAADRLGLSSS